MAQIDAALEGPSTLVGAHWGPVHSSHTHKTLGLIKDIEISPKFTFFHQTVPTGQEEMPSGGQKIAFPGVLNPALI